MPWNIEPFSLIYKPMQVRRTEHKTKAGVSVDGEDCFVLRACKYAGNKINTERVVSAKRFLTAML